jgi:hypothetical protein
MYQLWQCSRPVPAAASVAYCMSSCSPLGLPLQFLCLQRLALLQTAPALGSVPGGSRALQASCVSGSRFAKVPLRLRKRNLRVRYCLPEQRACMRAILSPALDPVACSVPHIISRKRLLPVVHYPTSWSRTAGSSCKMHWMRTLKFMDTGIATHYVISFELVRQTAVTVTSSQPRPDSSCLNS